ncbi:MAG: protein translocase SEC61 complex subunit gamma [Euryarchaeota archaeon]|nr:protein translocase SEC61 complex subunit gamma [Euryarchaeota archaeon]
MAKKQRTPSSTPKKQQEAPEGGRFSINTIKRKLREYQRILTLTRRPTRQEFSTIAKVAAIGIVIIGAVGFIIYLAMVQAPQNLGITNATHTQQTATAGTQSSAVSSEINSAISNSSSTLSGSTQNTTTGIAAT